MEGPALIIDTGVPLGDADFNSYDVLNLIQTVRDNTAKGLLKFGWIR
jgi:hypothetical protein